MNAIKIFVAATVTGMGLAVGIGIILGWVLLLRSWVHASMIEQTQSIIRFLI
jgi:hypothetical protein